MMIEAVPPPKDVSWIRLRDDDERECAAEGYTGAEALRMSIDASQQSWMVLADREPVAFWGYSLHGVWADSADAWLLTLNAVEPFGYRLARVSKRIVDFILTQAPVVIIRTHVDHAPACKWLRWLGFEPHGEPDAVGLQYMIRRR